jgi:hypothetical protein
MQLMYSIEIGLISGGMGFLRRHRVALSTLLLGGAMSGCTTTIIPSSDVREAGHVFVVDHGRTSSLVIPSNEGMLRYAYGDWAYYALRKTDPWHGIAALLWPTQGALGRAQLAGPASAESVRTQLGGAHAVHAVRVERASIAAFERRMDALFRSRIETEVENVSYGLRFVHHPRPYTYWWNSNHAVASWLRELGCSTHGLSFHSAWRVRQPP